jgi:hypothetical protein
MSLRINKDNIYFIPPKRFNKYNHSDDISGFMEKDFTISVRVKIYKENMNPLKEAYIFSRNGMHSGIVANLNNNNEIEIKFLYWFTDSDNNTFIKNIFFTLSSEFENDFNSYTVTCDEKNKVIDFYLNDIIIESLYYNELNRKNYTEEFIWIGCGSMIISDPNYKFIGDFEYEYIYLLDKKLLISEIIDINKNYKLQLDYDSEYILPILNNNIEHFENFKIFTDFDYRSKYKLWNMANNHNFFQLYIENNIIY